MKKYLSVILEIILTACLVACGSSNKDSVNDDKQEVKLGKMNRKCIKVAKTNNYKGLCIRHTFVKKE